MPVITKLPGLSCHFEDVVPTSSDGVLAVVTHGYTSSAPAAGTGGPVLRIAVPQTRLPGRSEVWRTDRAVVSGREDDLVFAHDGRYLFCAGRIRHDADYATGTESVYLRALDLIERAGYPDVARMWNIVGGITEPVDGPPGTDRYSEFCQARGRAFARRGLVTREMPAATGIGGHDAHTSVYFLATRHREIVRIENPRQVPAYEYPDRYGVQSPSFARAAYVRSADGPGDLFVSGTASILGHETVHHGNAEMQTRTTLENIGELVSGPNLRAHGIAAHVAPGDLDSVKVYVKNPRDFDVIRRVCSTVLGPECDVVYTIADVCREDLLVEIEAFASVSER